MNFLYKRACLVAKTILHLTEEQKEHKTLCLHIKGVKGENWFFVFSNLKRTRQPMALFLSYLEKGNRTFNVNII